MRSISIITSLMSSLVAETNRFHRWFERVQQFWISYQVCLWSLGDFCSTLASSSANSGSFASPFSSGDSTLSSFVTSMDVDKEDSNSSSAMDTSSTGPPASSLSALPRSAKRNRELEPRSIFLGHSATVEDALFLPSSPHPFRSVADDRWFEAYQAVEFRNPDTYSVNGYVAMQVLGQAAQTANTFDRAAVAAALPEKSLPEHPGPPPGHFPHRPGRQRNPVPARRATPRDCRGRAAVELRRRRRAVPPGRGGQPDPPRASVRPRPSGPHLPR